MKGKIVVCRCEDVTLHDVEHSIETGYADIEEIKRYTGFGTGPCQGKECLAVVAGLICRLTGREPDEMRPFTSRQPITPTPLALLASVELESRFHERPVYAQPENPTAQDEDTAEPAERGTGERGGSP